MRNHIRFSEEIQQLSETCDKFYMEPDSDSDPRSRNIALCCYLALRALTASRLEEYLEETKEENSSIAVSLSRSLWRVDDILGKMKMDQ